MALRTVICDLLVVDHPVLLAGMGGVSYAEVCAAVSDAGGFGSLGMAGLPPKFIADQMARVKDLTDKPFGVNLITMHPALFDLIAVCARHKVSHVVLAGGIPPKGSVEAITAAALAALKS